MKITIFLIALLWLCSPRSYAQTPYAIKGSVSDTTEKVKLLNATVMVLNAKDSTLQKYTRVTADGTFAINNLNPGKYILVLSYPKYADYTDGFTLDAAKKEYDFGKIGMVLKSKLLMDVIIKGQVTAIKIKGDTTEFNAKAYVIQPNSKVEDLLKQLPGIQVDKDGKITAQGQTVTKVLVDGEEFFGDDPTLVTKNIRGDMVDKVQLFDKKSDQATFTGIDDGVKTKTLNIKLKEDKKNGYFGRVDAGVGTNGFYQGQALYNKFKAKEKISAYATGANTGRSGLGWEDSQKYTDGGFDAGGDVLVYNNRGIPVSRMGGAHYDSKWKNDKQSINANYKIGSLTIDGVSNTLTQNNQQNSVLNTNSDQTFSSDVFRQKLDGTYQIQLDSTSNLKIAMDGAYRHTKTNNGYLTVGYRGMDTLINRNSRTQTNDAEQHIMNASAFYTKKLKKKGRTVSVLLSQLIDHTNGKVFVKSEADFYNRLTGALDSVQKLDQNTLNDRKHTQFNSNITYTEPLSKFMSVIINYGINLNENIADRQTYNQAAATPGVYDVFVPSLSNKYTINEFANQAGVGFNYTKAKTVLNFGTRASNVAFKQTDGYTNAVLKRNFVNWYPQVNYTYKFSQQSSLRLNYNGNTTQPDINQIQPVRNNSDPLNQVLGNPDLKPYYNSSFNASYNSYKVLTGQSLYINGSFSYTINPIVSNIVTDIAGKTTTQAFNLTDQKPYNYQVYGGANRKINGIDMNVGLNLGINGSTYYNMSNNALNTTKSTNYNTGISISKYLQKKYDFYVNAGPTYNIIESSLQKNVTSNGGGFSTYAYFNVYLPGKFQVTTDMNYTYTAPTQAFNESLRRAIWNATLSKTFLKDNTLKLAVSGNDLLNQNIGFNRSANNGLITQNSFTTIKRYFMVSVTWDFNKMGGMPAKK